MFNSNAESWLVQQAQYDLAHVRKDRIKLTNLEPGHDPRCLSRHAVYPLNRSGYGRCNMKDRVVYFSPAESRASRGFRDCGRPAN
jgi:hypothetical protein